MQDDTKFIFLYVTMKTKTQIGELQKVEKAIGKIIRDPGRYKNSVKMVEGFLVKIRIIQNTEKKLQKLNRELLLNFTSL